MNPQSIDGYREVDNLCLWEWKPKFGWIITPEQHWIYFMSRAKADELRRGWKMHVPSVFGTSEKSMDFRVGDIFYDTPRAYERTWNDALQHINTAFQVIDVTGDDLIIEVLRPDPERTKLVSTEKKTLSQEKFIALLKMGL